MFYLDTSFWNPKYACRKCYDNCSICKQDLTCICKINEYLINGQCKPCTPNCLTCKGPAEDQCVFCNQDYVEFEGKCEKQCLDGYRKYNYYSGRGESLKIY